MGLEKKEFMFWKDRAVLVTGSTGLLGSWLTRALVERGAFVVCVIREASSENGLVRSKVKDRVTVVRGDVCSQETLERALAEYEIATVFHVAAQAIVGIANRNPISTFESNIRGTWCLLEACRQNPKVKQIVVASSDKAYGMHEHLPYAESAPLLGRNPYDVSKACADLLSQSYAETYKLPVCITRCGNLYGGGDLNWNRIVPGTIRSVLLGERPLIRSDGSYVRDYFYVEDGALAYLLLAEQMATRPELAGEVFNFSNERHVTVLELAEKIMQLMGAENLELDVRNEAQHEIVRQYLDATKAHEMLDWRPRFSLEEGLTRSIEWYRKFLQSQESTNAACAVV